MLPLLLAASLWAREADAQTVQPSVSFTEEDYPAYENAGTAKITVRLASIQSTSTTVRISSANNTATARTDDAAGDYVGFENVDLTIPAGTLTASHTIQILQDSVYENGDGLEGEDFHVSVVSVNGVAPATAVETEVTIVDDEYTACFDSKTYLAPENAGVFTLPLRLSRALPFPVKATSTVVDHLSEEGVDYEVLKGTHTFKPGSQDGTFEIWIKDDKVVETSELFRITALVPSVPDGEAFCSTDIIIQENDVAPRTVSLIEQGARKGQDIVEGANGALGLPHFAGFEISAGAQITNGTDYVVEVCATSTTATRSADNTHTAGEDFVVQETGSGSALASGCDSIVLADILSIAAKATSSAVQIKAFGDTVHEAPETVTVTLTLKSNPGGLLKLGTSTLTYTIRDKAVAKRTVSLIEQGARKGQDITEGANGALGLPHFAGFEISAGAQITNGTDYVVEVCATSTTATRSADNTHTAGEDFVVQETGSGSALASGCDSIVLADILSIAAKATSSAVQIKAFGDTVHEAPETVTVTLTLKSNPGGLLELGTSTLTFAIRDIDDTPQAVAERTVSLIEQGARKGQDITEGANGALGLPHFAGFEISAGAQITNGTDYVVEVCATSTTATRSADNTHTAGEDFVVQETGSGSALASGCDSIVLADILSIAAKATSSAVQIKAFGDTVHEAPETVTVTLTLKSNPGRLLELGTSTLTYTIGDVPPATTEFELLDGGRSISLNEGQEATHKVVIGKPAAQALPCFAWGELSVVRDILFDRGRALDTNGCMKSWPGTPHVGYVIMELYINTNDDDVVQADPRFTIGLKNTRKDGSAEPAHGSQAIEVTVVNDDHTDGVSVHPHPGPMAWVEVKEIFDSLTSTDKLREFSDGTFCNADTPGTRTVTAPGGSGATRTCVKYFARHATHLKWTTGRGTNFNYDIWATRRGNADSRVSARSVTDGRVFGLFDGRDASVG